MGYRIPPRPDDPDFERKMLRNIRETSLMLGLVLGAAFVGLCLILLNVLLR